MITFIVSAYNRPDFLACLLYCLKVQTLKDIEVIVTDNAIDPSIAIQQKLLTESLGFKYVKTDFDDCYSSAEIGILHATKDYICFPSDDDYYVPRFAEIMTKEMTGRGLDLGYCDFVYDPRLSGKYETHTVIAKFGKIDKGGFVLKKNNFIPFPDKHCTSSSDGLLIEQLVSRGITHGRIDQVLFIHN